MNITIVGLGPGDIGQMPLSIYRVLKNTQKPIFLRTGEHPAAKELSEEGVVFSTFDSLYTHLNENFDQVYLAIVEALVKEAQTKDIVYAVPGHPMVAERTVELLLSEQDKGDVTLEFLGGKSFLDDLFQAMHLDPIDGFQLRDAFELNMDTLDSGSPLVVMQVFNDFVAGEVKLSLMERYPDEHQVALVNAAGSKEETITWVPLYELDRMRGVFNLLSVYVPPLARKEQTRSFDTLQYYIDVLFGETGDLWIQARTPESLIPYLREETEEVVEAILEGDPDHLAEELGDLLLHVLYQSNMGERAGLFSLEDVLHEVTTKIRRRHPHVFDGETVTSIADIEAIWERVKKEEKRQTERGGPISET